MAAEMSLREEMMRVLGNEKASDLLSLFLTKRYTEHSLHFYVAVQNWKKIPEGKKANDRAKQIYATYIEPNSRSQINLRESELSRIKSRMTQSEIAKDTFEEACNVCLSMIEYNHFLDFKESEDYKLMSHMLNDQKAAAATCTCVMQ